MSASGFSEDPTLRVKNLSAMGSSVEVDSNVPARRYFRSGMEMIRMADVYMEEGNLENAFILYSKYITLFVEKLPQHPDYKSSQPSERATVKKKLIEVFPRAELLKKSLLEKYSKEYAQWLSQKKRREEELAREKERIQKENEEKKRLDEERQKQEEEMRLKLQAELDRLKLLDISGGRNSNAALPLDNEMYSWPNAGQGLDARNAGLKEVTPSLVATDHISAEIKPNQSEVAIPSDVPLGGLPTVDRTKKPTAFVSPGSASHSELHQLRKIIIPTMIISKFLTLAQHNTSLNIETCGILTGKLCQNRFTITYLIVPKQRGTPDSCATDNEEEIFEFQDQHDLITLGWIHTHPSQTSFMSSVDLHTHCAYQLLLPEAVAIVCSPKYDETGVFTLTHDYGLNYVANCRQSGFHPHPKEPALYVESQHVEFDSSSTVTLIDLRCNK